MGPLEDIGPSGHPHEVYFWLLGQRHSGQCPAGDNFVALLWLSSSFCPKEADTGPTDGVRTFYGLVLWQGAVLRLSHCVNPQFGSMKGKTYTTKGYIGQ